MVLHLKSCLQLQSIMALKPSFLIACFMLVSFTSAADEDGYRTCNNGFFNAMQFEEPQLVKIKALHANAECYIRFWAGHADKYIELIFTEVDLGDLTMDYKHQNACKPEGGGAEAFVTVSEYYFNDPAIGQRICGQTNQLTQEQRYRRSTTNQVSLFYSNNIGRFQVQFNIVDTPGDAVCPDSIVELSGFGNIKFPPIGEELVFQRGWCQWRITASEGKRVKLHFRNMHVGDDIYFPYDQCYYVALNIFDRADQYDWPPLQQFCHQTLGRNVTELESTGNVFYLLHEAFQGYTGTGFEVDYEEI